MLKKIVYIVGPTGVGKTELAFKLAAQYKGELVNADSVQVYKGLDIVSGKDIPPDSQFHQISDLSDQNFNIGFYEVSQIPIYLLDVVYPSFSFTVSHFQNKASNIINLISDKNKLPIVVGGTGFYIKSLIDGIDTTLISPDIKLREELKDLDVKQLWEILKENNNEKFLSMNKSDRNNKRRLIRAIEISKSKQGNISLQKLKPLPEFVHLQIGLTAPREFLKEKIDKRVDKRLKEGAMEEVKKLFNNYEKLSQQVKDANGYKHLFMYLKNEVSLDEAIYRWKISEYRHAKNQMTWFKKYGNVIWFDITSKNYEQDIDSSLKKFLS